VKPVGMGDVSTLRGAGMIQAVGGSADYAQRLFRQASRDIGDLHGGLMLCLQGSHWGDQASVRSSAPDVRHPTATSTRIQVTQFASAQGGALATKLPAITRASCTSTTLAWPRTVISLPCAQFLVGRRRS
jgi:hypothetical protein